MAIPYSKIPRSELVPGRYHELDASRAGNFVGGSEAYSLGLMADNGEGEPKKLYQITSVETARKLFGARSMAAEMAKYYFMQTRNFPLRMMGLAEAVGATAAVATLTVTGSAAQSGTLHTYIGGDRISAGISAGATATEAAEAIVAAVNRDPYLLVSAANVAGVVTLTTAHKAEIMNEIPLVMNFLGLEGAEETPRGLTVACTPFAGGATNPTLQASLAMLADDIQHDWWGLPFADVTSQESANTALNDDTGRWSYDRVCYGHAFCTLSGSLSTLSAFGAAGNRMHVTTVGVQGMQCSPWNITAAILGRVSQPLTDSPAAPLTGLMLNGILPPPPEKRFAHSEKNILLGDGISTLRVVGNKMQVERLVTGYLLNDAGLASDALRNVQTIATTMVFYRRMDEWLSSRYARKILVQDEASVVSSRQISPGHIRRDLRGFGEKMVRIEIMEDVEAFMEALVVEIDEDNPFRINLLTSPVYGKPLYMFAHLLQPRFSASR